MNRLIAAVAIAVTAAAGIALGTLTPSPTQLLACGDTPGFCPNPPSTGQTHPQTHTVSSDGTVGTSQDF